MNLFIFILQTLLILCLYCAQSQSHERPDVVGSSELQLKENEENSLEANNPLLDSSKSTNFDPLWNDFRISRKPHKKHRKKHHKSSKEKIEKRWTIDSKQRRRKSRRHDRFSRLKNKEGDGGYNENELRSLDGLKALSFVESDQPTFDENSPSVVAAQIGSHAYLECRIHNLDDKAVSWIRNKDAHILTVDKDTFISDSRFVSHYNEKSGTWILQVKFTTPKDAGKYECQVSTEPKKSHFVTLTIIEPQVSIPGGTEMYVRSGSDVMVKCVIRNALIPPPYVFWYRDGKRVHKYTLGNVVHQSDVKKLTEHTSMAFLSINGVVRSHAGNYSCAPAGITNSASILLHVLNEEIPAAMQYDESNIGTSFHVRASNIIIIISTSVMTLMLKRMS